MAKNKQSGVKEPATKATPSPDTRKFAGAGPALAEHSKDAKAPKAGRSTPAYKKK